jgi:ferredoxin
VTDSPAQSVRVDAGLCQSTGYCARIAPTVFHVPEGGPAEVIDDHPAAELADALREAEDACPAAAIRVTAAAR